MSIDFLTIKTGLNRLRKLATIVFHEIIFVIVEKLVSYTLTSII